MVPWPPSCNQYPIVNKFTRTTRSYQQRAVEPTSSPQSTWCGSLKPWSIWRSGPSWSEWVVTGDALTISSQLIDIDPAGCRPQRARNLLVVPTERYIHSEVCVPSGWGTNDTGCLFNLNWKTYCPSGDSFTTGLTIDKSQERTDPRMEPRTDPSDGKWVTIMNRQVRGRPGTYCGRAHSTGDNTSLRPRTTHPSPKTGWTGILWQLIGSPQV